MKICGSFTHMLLVCLIVPNWNSESSRLVPHFWVPALVVRRLDLIWRLLPLRLRILSTNSIFLLATPFCPLLVKHVSLSRVSFFHATKENTELQQEVAYFIARLEKTILSEKMIEEDLTRVEESATKSTYRLGVGFKRCEDKGEKSAPKFIPSSTYHKDEATIKSTKAHYPSNPKPSFNAKREGRKKPPSQRELLCACFVAVLVTWMSFASGGRELRGDVLSMLENQIVMSSLMFHLSLILVFRLARTLVLCLALFLVLFLALSHVLCLALLLVLHLSSLMDPTITHIVLVHKRTALSLDTLVTAHVLIVVIVSRVGLVFPLEGPSPTLSRDTWMVHAFSVMVHVPLDQVVRCKGL
jgi:hypothetical protein